MFQQALWVGGTNQEDQGQEIDLLKSMSGAELVRGSAPEHFKVGSSELESRRSDSHLTENTNVNLMEICEPTLGL